MRKAFNVGSFIAVIALLALVSFSFSGAAFAQGGTTSTATTTGTDTAATTTTDADTSATTTTGTDTAATTTTGTDTSATTTTGTTTGGDTGTGSPSSLPNTAQNEPIAPTFIFPLLLALIVGAVLFFALAARRNVEK
jgi:hypothetical protein